MINRLKYQVKNQLLYVIGHMMSFGYDSSNTVMISGSPRSGTSWLGDLIAQADGAVQIWEPFHLKHQPDLRNHGFKWRTYIDDWTVDSEKIQIVRDVLAGRRLNNHTVNGNSLRDIFQRKFWVVKSVRANRFMSFLASSMECRTPICVIRHPAAVVSSQMVRRTKHQTVTEQKATNAWKGGLPEVAEDFAQRNPGFRDILESISTWEEILTASWCMDNFEIFRSTEKLPYLLVPYERLVMEPEKVLQSLFNHLELSWNDRYLSGVNRLSSTVVKGSNLSEGRSPIHEWKSRLDSTQVETIFRLLDRFGCRLYTEDPVPEFQLFNDKTGFPL